VGTEKIGRNGTREGRRCWGKKVDAAAALHGELREYESLSSRGKGGWDGIGHTLAQQHGWERGGCHNISVKPRQEAREELRKNGSGKRIGRCWLDGLTHRKHTAFPLSTLAGKEKRCLGTSVICEGAEMGATTFSRMDHQKHQ